MDKVEMAHRHHDQALKLLTGEPYDGEQEDSRRPLSTQFRQTVPELNAVKFAFVIDIFVLVRVFFTENKIIALLFFLFLWFFLFYCLWGGGVYFVQLVAHKL